MSDYYPADFLPTHSAEDEIQRQIGSLEHKIERARKDAEDLRQSAANADLTADHYERIRDEYRALVKAEDA